MASTHQTSTAEGELQELGQAWLEPGAKAVLRGLAKFPQLNGQQVEIVCWNAEKQRWKCLLPKGGDVNVFEANLEPAELAPSEVERLTNLFEKGRYFAVWEALHRKSATVAPQLQALLERQLKSGTHSEIIEGRIELVELEKKGKGYVAAKKVRQGDILLFDTAVTSLRIPASANLQGLNISQHDQDPFQAMARHIKQNSDRSFVDQRIMTLNVGSDGDRCDRLCRILERSTFECTREPGRMAFFSAAARFNHSCCPNAYADSSSSVCIIRALRDIPAREEVCISYVPVSDNRQTRQDKLKNYRFECDCERCQAEAEHDPQSMVQCMCGQMPFRIDPNTRLYQSCEHCCATFDREESSHRLSQVNEANQRFMELQNSGGDPRDCITKLTALESFARKGAKNGIPALHMGAMSLFNNLAFLHYQLSVREDGGIDSEFCKYMKQMIDLFEERHTTWTNQRDADYFQVLYKFLSMPRGLSEIDRKVYAKKLADACQVCFGESFVPESMLK